VVKASPFVSFEHAPELNPFIPELNPLMTVSLGLGMKEFSS
jgi:hypothetical protein